MGHRKEKLFESLSDYLRKRIKERKFDQTEFCRFVCEEIKFGYNCEVAFLDRNLNFVARSGFAASPSKLTPDAKSLDPESCLSRVIPLLKRQFTQPTPVLTKGKQSQYFHGSFALSATGEVPGQILVIRLREVDEEALEELGRVANYIGEQLYIFELHREEGQVYRQMIYSLQKVIESKHPFVYNHCLRVNRLVKTIGSILRLNDVELTHLGDAALIHEIGTVHVPNDILNKAGRLSAIEFTIVKKAVEESYRILCNKDLFDSESIAKIILFHMESFDGTGYPKGIKGNQIPRGSRILAIANAYDAMTNARPYQKSKTPEEALEELKRCAELKFDSSLTKSNTPCLQFDPEIVQKFVEYQREWID